MGRPGAAVFVQEFVANRSLGGLQVLTTRQGTVESFVSPSFGMPVVCEHKKTMIIARRGGVDYVECLDCKQIFEAEDLEPVAVQDDD